MTTSDPNRPDCIYEHSKGHQPSCKLETTARGTGLVRVLCPIYGQQLQGDFGGTATAGEIYFQPFLWFLLGLVHVAHLHIQAGGKRKSPT